MGGIDLERGFKLSGGGVQISGFREEDAEVVVKIGVAGVLLQMLVVQQLQEIAGVGVRRGAHSG